MEHGFGTAKALRAVAYGGGSALNAIATWKGSAFAVDLKVEVEVVKGEGDDSKLLRAVKEVVGERYNVEGLGLKVRSELPPGGGLKSSSAVANASVLALLRAVGVEASPYYVLKLSVEAAKRAKVTVTGAFDDASASLLGGLVITDNKEMVVEERLPLRGLWAVILPKSGRALSYDEIASRLRAYKKAFEKVYELLKSGNLFEAMTLNGALVASALGYSSEPAVKALEAGALAAGISGNGPSFVALVEKDKVEDVVEALRPYGNPVAVRTVDEPAYAR